MDTNTINWNLIICYLNRECSAEEEAEVLEWMNSRSDNQEFLTFLETIWQMEPGRRKRINAEAAWERFANRYNLTEPFGPDEPDIHVDFGEERLRRSGRIDPGKTKSIRWIGLTSMAACILVILVVLSQVFNTSIFQEDASALEAAEYREMTTERGQRARIILGDGSVVHLNSESHLKIPEVFRRDGQNRVYLEGEAFFEITNSENVRFQVVANGSVTTVLGTRFNVRSYPEDPMVTVVVANGEVSLGYYEDSETSPVYLYRNQKGVIGAGRVPEISDIENLSRYLGWTEGELIFDGEPLPDMIRKLERWFAVEIETSALEEESMNKKLTASFSERQPLDDVLQSISLVLGLSVEEAMTTDYDYKFSN